MSVGFAFVPSEAHDFPGHPEHAGRLAAVWRMLEAHDLLSAIQQLEVTAATSAQLEAVHSADVETTTQWMSLKGGGMIGGDTYTTPGTHEAALLAAGGACAVVDAICTGGIKRGAALVRPPGHHAGVRSIEGFCLFNNIAVSARHAQQQFGVSRIAIVDFDVHHGNGTQDIFYEDDSVLFITTQMVAPFFYPGSGELGETGRGDGRGMTVNVPFAPGVGDEGYLRVFDELIRPKLNQFKPELILVSAGFDGHWRDPLAHANLSLTGYAHMTQRLISWANELCDGKIGFVLEGGYDLEVLGYGIVNLLYAMLDREQIVDPLGNSTEPESDITKLLVKLQQQHLLV